MKLWKTSVGCSWTVAAEIVQTLCCVGLPVVDRGYGFEPLTRLIHPADAGEGLRIAVPKPYGPRLDGWAVELTNLQGGQGFTGLSEIAVGAAAHQKQLGPSRRRQLRNGCIVQQFQGFCWPPERSLAVGHDRNLVGEASHPPVCPQLRQGLGILTSRVGR